GGPHRFHQIGCARVRLAQHHLQRCCAGLCADGADHRLADRRHGAPARRDDSDQARGQRGRDRRDGGVLVLAARGLHHGPGHRGRRRPVPLMAIIERHRDEVAIQGGELPEILLPTNCPGCGIGLAAPELRAHNYVCLNCGHHFRLGADVWVSLIADAESWQERWTDVRSHDLLNWTVPKRYQETVETLLEAGLNEAVRTGTCTLGGKPIWLAT